MRDECRSVPVERPDTEHRFSPRERREEKRKAPEEQRDERSRKAPRKFVQLSRDGREREREREKQKNTGGEKERKEDGKRYKHSQRSLRGSARASSGRRTGSALVKGNAKRFYPLVDIPPRADDGRTHNQHVNPNNRARDKRWAITNKLRPEQERERERLNAYWA